METVSNLSNLIGEFYMHPLRPLALWISLLSPSLWAATTLPNPALSHQMLTSHFSVLMDKSHLKVPHPPSHALLLVGQHQDAHRRRREAA